LKFLRINFELTFSLLIADFNAALTGSLTSTPSFLFFSDVGGDGGHGYFLNKALFNNIVLKSFYNSVDSARLRFCHANPGSAAAHIDDLDILFSGTDMHVICISKTWFKKMAYQQEGCSPGLQADLC
jgi:hypothetical protein